MRIELAGSLIRPEPLVFIYDVNGNFYMDDYRQQGYTHFDVICIGSAGGAGGGVNTGGGIRCYGGAGGGGGFHRVRGLLSALSVACPIVVGQGGAVGNDSGDPASTTDGSDGGASTFNGTTCQASGGKGGKRASSNSGAYAGADGGDGGVGNRTNAGGGALGGGNNRAGADGTFINNIGKGGGGGAGGVGTYGGGTQVNATVGGRGSYNPSDLSVYGPGGPIASDTNAGIWNIVPGWASGAKAAPLTGLPTVYGQSQSGHMPGLNGIVVLRLTAE